MKNKLFGFKGLKKKEMKVSIKYQKLVNFHQETKKSLIVIHKIEIWIIWIKILVIPQLYVC